MRKPVLTIFYQYNPWHSSIGGIQTLISSFIKYAPENFNLRLVGVGDRSIQKIGVWQEAELHGRVLQFFPLFALENDDVRRLVPTTVKYTAALLGRCFASDFMHFHRMEPTLTTLRWSGDKTLFIHNDIRAQFLAEDSKQALLWRYMPRAYFAMERLLVRQFNQILSCNSASTQLYQQLYPSLTQRITHYHNSVDTEIFYPLSIVEREVLKRQFLQKLGLPAKTRLILFAGRLHPQKDPLLLVRSLACLTHPHIHLLIAGEGELADAVRREVVQLGLSGKVTMLGAVKQAELANLHRISSVCILTSTHEGLPLVVLESLACGTPVVTTKTGDTPALLVEGSGLVSQERTPEAIADSLQRVLHRPDYFSPQACIQAVASYSAKAVIHNLYDTMLKRWSCRGSPERIMPDHSYPRP